MCLKSWLPTGSPSLCAKWLCLSKRKKSWQCLGQQEFWKILEAMQDVRACYFITRGSYKCMPKQKRAQTNQLPQDQ